ncbi:hypothetical protein ANMWB30_39120 [Arthrobacter sp. MWB30]|nr:hypothetical protein ANMWB30_39120 [Arthrobacter sp. MWB30]
MQHPGSSAHGISLPHCRGPWLYLHDPLSTHRSAKSTYSGCIPWLQRLNRVRKQRVPGTRPKPSQQSSREAIHSLKPLGGKKPPFP